MAPSKFDLKGMLPETWACVDCGINTAPGCTTRSELELRFNNGEDGVEQTFGHRSEVYSVRSRVWEAAGMAYQGGCLCIGCLERRLGRHLKPKDFPRHDALNTLPGSARLLDRRGRR